jgi:hypothetical protein
MADDFFKRIATRAAQPVHPDEDGRILAVGRRAKTSEEIEARERAYLNLADPQPGNSVAWPIPIFDAIDAAEPLPLLFDQIEDLQKYFHLSESEWVSLVRRNIKPKGDRT